MVSDPKIERLIKIREKLGLNKAQMASAMVISSQAYWAIENKKNKLSKQVEELLIYKMKVNPAFLENGEGDILIPEETNDVVNMKMQIEDLRAQVADLMTDKKELKDRIKELEIQLAERGSNRQSKAS